jgi:Outer membrane receptor for ferrienterochelin and colicins
LDDQQFIKKTKPVSIKVKDAQLEDVLKAIFKNQPVTYQIDDKVVTMISLKETSISNHTKQITRPDSAFWVQGRVLSEDGFPLSGASISAITKLAMSGVSTNAEGKFRVYVEKGDVLIITHIGNEETRVPVTQKQLGDIRVRRRVEVLEEAKVVIGYGTTTKALGTGNVSVVTSKDIAKQPVANVLQALQGLIPGMTVNQQNGFASSTYDLKIRGQNNISATGLGVNSLSEPLYIIDGVPLISGVLNQQNVGVNQNGFQGPTSGQSPLYALNPSDVESISVLKDADATSIYGARGANGVILITTKKGKPGRASLSANVYTGTSMQTRKLNLMNTPQYLEMRERAFMNDKMTPEVYNGYDLLLWDQNRYTDWQKEFYHSASTTDAQLTLSGGDAKTTYRINGGFNAMAPPLRGDYKEQRGAGILSLSNSSFNDKLTTTAMVNFSSTVSSLPSLDPSGLIFLIPNAPSLLTDDGNLNFEGWRAAGGLPFSAAYLKRPYSAKTINLISNLTVKYQILPDLYFSSSFGYNIARQNQLTTSPSGSFDPMYGVGRESRFGINNSSSWIIEPLLNYNKHIGLHHIEVLAGSTFQDQIIEGSDITARGFTSDASLENLAGATSMTGLSNFVNTRFQSFYSRISYNYDGKYIINLNGRRDGSSRFATDNHFGNFGSIGAAWVFSNESFIKNNLKFLSFGKLRGSYGLVGSDGLGDYQYLASFSATNNPYQDVPVFTLSRLANSQFSWTTNKKAELALALGFLNGRINTEISLYNNRSGNQLVSMPQPAITGFKSVVANLPALVENKGIEFTLQTQNIKTRDLSWNTNFNISRNRNTLLKFPELENSVYNRTYAIGRSINATGMLAYNGIDPETGYYQFKDISGNGMVSLFGNEDYLYKDGTPSFFGGVNNDLSYKSWQLSILFSFTKQQGVLRLSNQLPGSIASGLGNQLILSEQLSGKPVLDNLTTASYRPDLNSYYSSDAVWVDASYIRLQNLSLAYNLPASWLKRIKAQNLRLYLQAQNLLTITGYKGPDPSSPGSFSLPPRKIVTVGIQITL